MKKILSLTVSLAITFMLITSPVASIAGPSPVDTNDLSRFSASLVAEGDVLELVLGEDENGVTFSDILIPGEEYNFPISFLVEGGVTPPVDPPTSSSSEAAPPSSSEATTSSSEPTPPNSSEPPAEPVDAMIMPRTGTEIPLTDEYMDLYTIRISKTGSGNTVSSIRVIRSGGVYYLSIDIKDGYPAKLTEEEYTLRLISEETNDTIDTLTITFETGYPPVEEEYINSLDEDDYILVDEDRPVFTEDQLEEISEINNYNKATFSGEGWDFIVNVTETDDINMINDRSVATEILDKYPDYNFEFLNFKAKPQFRSRGTMELNVEDYAELYKERFYVYEYSKGVMTPLAASYDTETGILSFDTNMLGHFVISDTAVPYLNVNNSSNPETGANA